MTYFLEVPQNAKKFSGTRRQTFPEIINQDLKKTSQLHPEIPVKQFGNAGDLKNPRKVAEDREIWKNLKKLSLMQHMATNSVIIESRKVQERRRKASLKMVRVCFNIALIVCKN